MKTMKLYKGKTLKIITQIYCLLAIGYANCLALEVNKKDTKSIVAIPISYFGILGKSQSGDMIPVQYKEYKCIRYANRAIPEKLDIMWFCTVRKCETPKEKAFAFLWHDVRYLYVCVVMEDSDVKTKASGRHDISCMKGDMMELFFQAADSLNYYEFHLAPNLSTLELSYPSVKAFKSLTSAKGLKKFFFDSEFKCKSGKFLLKSGVGGWWGYMKVPLSKLGTSVDKLANSRIAVCRYNYNSAWGKKPEVSTSATIRKGSFHQPSRWNTLKK